MIKRSDKKAEMPWVVIGLIMAIVVLVILVFFITQGTGTLGDFWAQHFSSVNVDTVRAACENACAMNSRHAWCDQKRDVNYQEEDGNIGTESDVTCDKLEGHAVLEKYFKGLSCAGITCVQVEMKTCWKIEGEECIEGTTLDKDNPECPGGEFESKENCEKAL